MGRKSRRCATSILRRSDRRRFESRSRLNTSTGHTNHISSANTKNTIWSIEKVCTTFRRIIPQVQHSGWDCVTRQDQLDCQTFRFIRPPTAFVTIHTRTSTFTSKANITNCRNSLWRACGFRYYYQSDTSSWPEKSQMEFQFCSSQPNSRRISSDICQRWSVSTSSSCGSHQAVLSGQKWE